MKNLETVIKEIRDSAKNSTVSKSNFNEIATAVLNETELKSSSDFREFVVKFLISAGVDQQDAEALRAHVFTNKDTQWAYEFVKDVLGSYLQTGRKFSFENNMDSISAVYREESERTYTIPNTKDTIKKTVPAHWKLSTQRASVSPIKKDKPKKDPKKTEKSA